MIRIPKTRSKYHAKPTMIDGIKFPSHKEARYYLQLKQLQKAGEVIGIECQPAFELQPAYQKCCGRVWWGNLLNKSAPCGTCDKKIPITAARKYVADFRVRYRDGHEEIVDVKGMETPLFILKKVIFEFKYPDLTLIVIGGKR